MGAKFIRDLYEACDDTFGTNDWPDRSLIRTMRNTSRSIVEHLPQSRHVSIEALTILDAAHDCPNVTRSQPCLSISTTALTCLVGICTAAEVLEQVCTADRTGKYTVPVFWDKQTKTIVNNESSEIVRFLNTEFQEFAKHPEVINGMIPPVLSLRPYLGSE